MLTINRLCFCFIAFIILFTACTQEKSQNTQTIFSEGFAAYQQGDLNTAVRRFDQVVKNEPENANFRYAYALVLTDLNKPQTALNELKQCIQLDPHYAPAIYLLNDAFRETRQLAAGSEFWEQQLQQHPNCWLYFAQGELLYYQSQDAKAMQMMDRAIALNPDYSLAHSVKGLIDLNHDRLPEALENFQQAVATNALYSEGFYYLSYIYHKMGNTAESEKYFRIAQQMIPNLPPVATLSDTAETISYASPASVADKLVMRVNYKGFNDEPKPMIRLFEFNFGDKKLKILPIQPVAYGTSRLSPMKMPKQLPAPSRYATSFPIRFNQIMPIKIPLDSVYVVNFFKKTFNNIHEQLIVKVNPAPVITGRSFNLEASTYTPLFNHSTQEIFKSIPFDSTITINGNKKITLKEQENFRVICDLILAEE